MDDEDDDDEEEEEEQDIQDLRQALIKKANAKKAKKPAVEEEDDDEDEDDDEAGLLLVVSGMSTTVPSPPVPARTVLPVPYWMSTTGLGRESLVVSPRVFLQLGWLLTSRSSLHDSSKPRVQVGSQMW